MKYYSINWSLAVFLLLYLFTPTIVGGFYITLLSIVLFSVSFLILKSVKILQFNGILNIPNALFFLVSAITLSITITLTLNASFFSIIGLSDIMKPLVFMLLFVFAANSSLNYSEAEIKKTLLLVSKIIIVGQFIVVIDQVFIIDVFSRLYDYGKSSSTGDISTFRRSTGTLQNPNSFAWIILQSAVIIFLFSRNTSRYFWMFLAFFMVLLSGSKSMTAAFPLALLVAGWLKGDRVIFSRNNLYLLLTISILIFIGFKLLINYPTVFPRLLRLMQILSGEDEGGGGRFQIWETAYIYFQSKEGFLAWLFGLGPIEQLKGMDNGYLYTLFRNGIFGLLLHLTLLLYFIVKFYKFEDRELGALGAQYVVIGSLSELQAEAFAGWNYPIHLFLYAGIIFSYECRRQYAVSVGVVNSRYHQSLPGEAKGSMRTA